MGRIDSTYATVPSPCGSTTKYPANGATIGSYGQLWSALDWKQGFHPVIGAEALTYWNANKQYIPILPAPSCTLTAGAWITGTDGYDSRNYKVTPTNCRGILPEKLLRRTLVTPTCTSFTYSAWGPCIGGVQTRTALSSSPSSCIGGTPVLSQSCSTIVTKKVSVKGTPYTGYTLADTIKAVNGITTDRWLSTGPTTVTWTFNQPVTINWINLLSGYQGGSPNKTLTLSVDGLDVPLNYVPNINFTKTLNVTGTAFKAVTTGQGNISRIFEISLSK